MGKVVHGTYHRQVEQSGASTDHDDCEIHALLGEILEKVEGDTGREKSHNGNGHGGNGHGSEIVFEVSLETARYTLIRTPLAPLEPGVGLSPREQEIARLVAKGLPNKAIAAVLDISPWTVGTHLRRVFGKLGVGSRAEMVARVLEEDLLAEV